VDRLFPLFLRLEGRRVLVVGGGPVASSKALELHAQGARIDVVAPEVVPELAAIAHVAQRPFEASDVDGAWLVIAAAPRTVNRAVREAADARATFVVAVDDVPSCTAFGASRFVRGGITVALSSGGRAPALVALLRRALEALLPDDLDRWTALAEIERARWKREGTPMSSRRSRLLEALIQGGAR
jgi:siroheme synthase-like protein